MNWIRTDCYEARTTLTTTAGSVGGVDGGLRLRSDSEHGAEDDDCHQHYYSSWQQQPPTALESQTRRRTGKCPIHPLIRHRKWSEVTRVMKQDPSNYILQQNGQGWSSMTLCLYHSAPLEVISEMISLLSIDDQHTLLSTRIPNGSRVCLHFAARYATEVETIQVLTEAFPSALLMASDDGILPVDRAIYYRKDAAILHYLEQRTKQQRNVQLLKQFNTSLRYTVLLACEHYHHHQPQQQPQPQQWGDGSPPNHHGNCQSVVQHSQDGFIAGRRGIFGIPKLVIIGSREIDEDEKQLLPRQQEQDLWLVKELYNYCKEREVMGMFWNVLSFVGVESIA